MITAIIIFWCMVLSFFFSGMETGVLLLNRARIRHLKERGSFGARILLDFLHHPGHLSSTVLVGNTLVNGIATVLVAEWFLEFSDSLTAIGAVTLFTFILWFCGDLVAKAIFRRFPNRLTVRLAPLLQLAYFGLCPAVRLFHVLSQGVIRIVGGKVSPRQMFVTRDELKLMAEEVKQGTLLSGEQRNLVASILDNQNATVQDIMRPRENVVTVKKEQSDEERRKAALTKGFSRLPVGSNGLQEQALWDGLWVVYDSIFEAKVKLRDPPRVGTEVHLEEILVSLRKARSPFAFVKNQEGHDIGIITTEDILRHYIGKIEL